MSPSAFPDAQALAAQFSALATAGRRVGWIDTVLGGMVAVADDALHLLEFHDRPELPRELAALGRLAFGTNPVIARVQDQLAAYFAGRLADFSLPLALSGTPFQRLVWQQLLQVPAGQTRSYAQLAASMGRPDAVRAVGRANGANRIAVVVPCHRIIGSGGQLTGYAGGLMRKQALIRHESDRFAGQAGAAVALWPESPGEKA